ncbi:MAG: hypothetical protein JWM20_373 [Patescibacteria group bacterium]|nr:hypothetical protein [Patescibacteria group bacterium]
MITDDDSHLRKLNSGLYTGDGMLPNARRVLRAKKVDAPDSWSDPAAMNGPVQAAKLKPPSSAFKKIFFGSLGVLVIAIAIFAFSFLTGGNTISSKNVEITITAKTFVDGGESLPVDVTIVNKNKLPLELATLTLQYPEGNAQNPDAVATISRDIGTMAVGETRNESFNIKLYGQQNAVENLSAHLQFDVSGSNAIYGSDQIFAVTIRTSPVLLTLDAPDSAIPNQEIPLRFNVVGNGTATLSNTALVLSYPPEFAYTRADPIPSFQNNVWDLGDLPPGANRTITVYGKFSGALNSAQAIKASIGAQNANNQAVLDTVYNDIAQVIPLSKAFLATQISVNGKTNPTVAIGPAEAVQVLVPLQNTLSVPITNAEIHVALSGTAYDPTLVRAGSGYFKSDTNEIVWTAQQTPELASLAPGQTSQVSFSITPKKFSAGTGVTNPSIKISASVIGYGAGGVKQAATDIDQKTILINSDLNLLASTLHYSGGIANTGPMPLQPNKETTYTLVWQITNFRNRVTGVTVTTTLPTNVTWKDVELPASERANVTYNSVTKTLQWNVGDVPAGTGTAAATKTISMKVGITPSSQQSGSIADLTGPITIMGHDTFTGTDMTINHRSNTTQLLNDSSTVGADGKVQ